MIKKIKKYSDELVVDEAYTIGCALTVIDNKARELRDRKNIYRNVNDDIARKAEKQMNILYKIKDDAMDVLVECGMMFLIGYYNQDIGYDIIPLGAYGISDFIVYRPLSDYTYIGRDYYDYYLGDINGVLAVDNNVNQLLITFEQAINILNEVVDCNNKTFWGVKKKPETLEDVIKVNPAQIIVLRWIRDNINELESKTDDFFNCYSNDQAEKCFEFLDSVVNEKLTESGLPPINFNVDLVMIPDEYVFYELTPKEEQTPQLYEELEGQSSDMWNIVFDDVRNYIGTIERRYDVAL